VLVPLWNLGRCWPFGVPRPAAICTSLVGSARLIVALSFMLRCEDPLPYAYGGQLTPTHTMALVAANVVQRLVNGGAVDGGIAAVLGAMAGTIGTMSAAALTVKVTRWQVRAQDTSALMQWRRQMRREAYAEFLAFAVEASDALAGVESQLTRLSPQEDWIRDCLEPVADMFMAMRRKRDVVSLEGPSEVEAAANDLMSAMSDLYYAVRAIQRALLGGTDRESNVEVWRSLLSAKWDEVARKREVYCSTSRRLMYAPAPSEDDQGA